LTILVSVDSPQLAEYVFLITKIGITGVTPRHKSWNHRKILVLGQLGDTSGSRVFAVINDIKQSCR